MLIVGAGAAGLAASRMLTAAGLRIAILEARNRIGGRIYTIHESLPSIADVPIELGAEFIHGLPATSWNLIREARLDTYEADGSQLCFEGSRLQHCRRELAHTFEVLESMSSWLKSQPPHTDLSFAEYLRINPVAPPIAERTAAYVEGFNAADRNIVGIAGLARQQQAEDLIQGDRLFRLRDGYEGLTRFLSRESMAQGGTLLLKHPVSASRWQPRQVSLGGKDMDGNSFEITADQMLCTLPLGVLQSGAVEFQPGLPDLAEAVSHLKVGCAQRVSLLFRSKFWAEDAQLQAHPAIENQLKELSFLFAKDTRWPTWWTAAPHTAPVITAWAAGPKAARLGADQLMESAVEDVTRIFSLSQLQIRENLLSARCHDWQADPYSRGAYSYVPSGAIEASARMCQPHADTLFFAGEHTDVEGHWGTVHAALNSGERAAAQILQTR